MRSAPESFKHPPAEPQLVTLALRTRKGPGLSASPTLRRQAGPCPPLPPGGRPPPIPGAPTAGATHGTAP
eukprot:1373693-Lingulodinium_polyedra.AAC.1